MEENGISLIPGFSSSDMPLSPITIEFPGCIDDPSSAAARASQTWAMLIKRVYEIDPLSCPHCGGQMKVIAFIEPPQADVIEKILRHCGLWRPSTPRPPPDAEEGESACDMPGELTKYVDEATFSATF